MAWFKNLLCEISDLENKLVAEDLLYKRLDSLNKEFSSKVPLRREPLVHLMILLD